MKKFEQEIFSRVSDKYKDIYSSKTSTLSLDVSKITANASFEFIEGYQILFAKEVAEAFDNKVTMALKENDTSKAFTLNEEYQSLNDRVKQFVERYAELSDYVALYKAQEFDKKIESLLGAKNLDEVRTLLSEYQALDGTIKAYVKNHILLQERIALLESEIRSEETNVERQRHRDAETERIRKRRERIKERIKNAVIFVPRYILTLFAFSGITMLFSLTNLADFSLIGVGTILGLIWGGMVLVVAGWLFIGWAWVGSGYWKGEGTSHHQFPGHIGKSVAVFVICLAIVATHFGFVNPVLKRYSEFATAQKSLEYALVNDGVAYEVTGTNKTDIVRLKIPNTYNNLPVVQIANGAFEDKAPKLKELILSSNMKSIGYRAFANCSSLTNIYLNDGLETIGGEAFRIKNDIYNNYSHAIFIPKSVENIGAEAFFYRKSATLNCEATYKPSEWDANWHRYDSFFRSYYIRVNWGASR
ncbi:MAG: leucine-rich repeat domain-containing protein [Firmicutes bacterium]|nr:leucine-rich repeat domain-containing protein [Bacillota bacterium]